MSGVKHTPAPWAAVGAWVEHPNDDIADICNCDPESMGQERFGRSDQEILANARLIAAAPELLGACMAWIAFWDSEEINDSETEDECLENMRFAISLATKGEPWLEGGEA